MTERAALPGAVTAAGPTAIEAVNSLIDDLVRPTTEVGRVIAAVAQGDLSQKMALTIEGQPVKGEFRRIGTTVNAMVDQLGVLRRRGHARGARGRHRGQARRPGRGQGRQRHVARPDRLRERDGREPHRAGAPDRPGHDRGGQRRPDPADHRRRARRGRSSSSARSTRWSTRLSSFADEVTRVAREVGTDGELGGQAAGRGRLGHVARPHRVGERDGVQPDRPGAPDRAGHDRGRATAT